MLSRYVRIFQLGELALYAALGARLHQGGATAASIAAALLAIALGWRLAFVALQFAIAWLHRSRRAPSERIGPLAAVALLLREFRALLVFSVVHLPWERQLLRPDPPAAPGPGTPVVLAHGYFANRGCFRPLVRRLEAAGLGPVFTPNLRSWFAPIERYEEELHAHVERIASGCGRRVVLVGHSMGGLGIRTYLARRGTGRVAGVVTLGSPHQGTALAAFGVGENGRQMRRGSALLAALQAAEGEGGPGVPATSIYSCHDNMVAPQDSSILPWARNLPLPGRGHVELLSDAEAARRVVEAVRALA